jgi:hypothetical protein
MTRSVNYVRPICLEIFGHRCRSETECPMNDILSITDSDLSGLTCICGFDSIPPGGRYARTPSFDAQPAH